ncbi:hypothetical protein [Virgibacillus sp. L01]|uniref:hypothetical protein n=1 Tax=Virgibacillus sp. L01 TaxID=3457429 RepID=UPI003FCFE42E
MIKVLYKLDIVNLRFDEVIEIAPSEILVKKIEMLKEEDQVHVWLCFDEGIDLEVIKDVSESELYNLTRMLFYKLNIITLSHYRVRIETKEFNEVTSRYPIQQILYKELSSDEIIEIKNILVDSLPILNNNYMDLYYSAMNIHEPVARYMFLYSILLQEYRDSKRPQEEIDNYIRDFLGDVEERNSTKHNNMETIYTFLRNQIGHTQEYTDIKKLREEVTEHTKNLSDLVKNKIFNEIK